MTEIQISEGGLAKKLKEEGFNFNSLFRLDKLGRTLIDLGTRVLEGSILDVRVFPMEEYLEGTNFEPSEESQYISLVKYSSESNGFRFNPIPVKAKETDEILFYTPK